MKLLPRRGASIHLVAVAAFALALAALALIIVGSNLRWWVIVDVHVDHADLFSSLGLKPDMYRFFLEMGLDQFDLRFHPTKQAVEKRGFYPRTDSFLWGILSHHCSNTEGMTQEICDQRATILSLASSMYVLLSFASLALTATMGMLVLSSSPVLNFKTTTTFYVSSALLTLVALLTFELKLQGIMQKPESWGIWDHSIRSTFAGVDATKPIPLGSAYVARLGISRVMVWIAFGCILGSLACFLFRVYRTRQSKKYLNTFSTLFKSRPSMFLSNAEMSLSDVRSRRVSTQDSL